MVAVVTLLLVLVMSILVTRVATIALVHTGLSRESARFQARSAFTGAGFTTSESEQVVKHPVRRRIVGLLMLLGNAGLVTAASSLILTFVRDREGGSAAGAKIAILVVGVILLWLAASSRWVDKHLSRLIDKMLERYTDLDVRDYANLMHLGGEYRLVEMSVQTEDWLNGKTLAVARLREEGILVLGIERPDGTYLGSPRKVAVIAAGDVLLLYGRVKALADLDCRRLDRHGDKEHLEAVKIQEDTQAHEAEADPAAKVPPAPAL